MSAPLHVVLPIAAEDCAVKQEGMIEIHVEKEFKVDRRRYQGSSFLALGSKTVQNVVKL